MFTASGRPSVVEDNANSRKARTAVESVSSINCFPLVIILEQHTKVPHIGCRYRRHCWSERPDRVKSPVATPRLIRLALLMQPTRQNSSGSNPPFRIPPTTPMNANDILAKQQALMNQAMQNAQHLAIGVMALYMALFLLRDGVRL